MKAVYKYKVFDINSGYMKFFNSYATKEFIVTIEGAEVLNETAKYVHEKELDGDGRLVESRDIEG